MALVDYNPIGGTSQSLIDDYHRQMADIDRQLYTTGSYTGPVYDPKTKTVHECTLNKRAAKALKDKLWYEADKLEGYALADRHQPNKLKAFFAAFARMIKMLNPIYTFRRIMADRLYQNATAEIYASEAAYDMMAAQSKSPTKMQTVEKDVKTPELSSPDKGLPHEQFPAFVVTPKLEDEQALAPEGKEEQEHTDNKTDYQEQFYKKADAIVAMGKSKDEAIIELLQKNPIQIYDVKSEDINKEIALTAVTSLAQKKNLEPKNVVFRLIRKIPEIAQIDPKAPEFEGQFYKYVPSIIEKNPETLKYLSEKQINKKTCEYLLNDIERTNPERGAEAKQEFLQNISEIDAPAAKAVVQISNEIMQIPEKTPDILPEPPLTPPVMPAPTPCPIPAPPFLPQEEEQSWKDIPELTNYIGEIELHHPEIEIAPPAIKDIVLLKTIMQEHPDLYAILPEKDVTTEIAAYAVLHDPQNIDITPEFISTDDVIEKAMEIAEKNYTIDALKETLDYSQQELGITDDIDRIINAIQAMYDQKVEKAMESQTQDFPTR